MATTPTGPSSRTQAIQNTDNSRCAAEFRRVTSLPMFSFGGRRQNGGHGKAPIQTQPPAPFEVTEGRHLPDGAAKASESAFAPLKIMLLCHVVMPARNSSPSASQAFRFMRPSSLLHGSSQHVLDESNRRILADLSWAPFPCMLPPTDIFVEEPRGKPSTLAGSKPADANDASRPVVCMSARAHRKTGTPAVKYLVLSS